MSRFRVICWAPIRIAAQVSDTAKDGDLSHGCEYDPNYEIHS